MALVPSVAPGNAPDQYVDPIYVRPPADEDNAKIFLIDILAAIHRNRKLAITVATLSVLLVLTVTFLLTPLYQSTAQVMLDTRHEQVVDLQAVLSNLPSDTFVVDSEVQVLQSPALAELVIDKLHLDQDPEFNTAIRPPTLLGQVRRTVTGALRGMFLYLNLPLPVFLGGGPVGESIAVERRKSSLIGAFERRLNVSRQGLTYLINISFWSEDAAKSMRIANAVATTYLAQQKNIKASATRNANMLIQKHVSQLQVQLRNAEQAVAAVLQQLRFGAGPGSGVCNRLHHTHRGGSGSAAALDGAEPAGCEQLHRRDRAFGATATQGTRHITEHRSQESGVRIKESATRMFLPPC